MNEPLAMSIIVAVTDIERSRSAQRECPEWLAALLREARAVAGEIILVGALGALRSDYEKFARSSSVDLRVLDMSGGALAPELWGRGLLASSAEVVAFTINQCVVQEGWAQAALGALAGALHDGVGGPIELAATPSVTARAIYFLRYSAFLVVDAAVPREVRDIAGDNAAYRRATLMRFGSYAHGFWEIEPHHAMRAEGATLVMTPGMTATFGGAPQLGTYMRQRFAHGKHFGAWRVALGGRKPWQMVVAAPLVPLVLLMRTARRVSAVRGKTMALSTCLLPFLSLAIAWAAGEAAGALARDATTIDPHRR